MSAANQEKRKFVEWADAVEVVSRSNGFTDEQVINTWPDDVKRHYPELTVGSVRYAAKAVDNYTRLAYRLEAIVFADSPDNEWEMIKKAKELLDELGFMETENKGVLE